MTPFNKAKAAEAVEQDDALAGDVAAARAASGDDSNEEIAKLESELTEAKDRALRAQAELENYRRRAQRELDDSLRYANMSLMRDLLPVVDNLNRAAEAAGQASDASVLLSGVRMVLTQFEEVLAKHHCKRIVAQGEPFDPNIHEAIAQQPSQDQEPGTVLIEATTGFRLHDRVVRPTQVVVSQ